MRLKYESASVRTVEQEAQVGFQAAGLKALFAATLDERKVEARLEWYLSARSKADGNWSRLTVLECFHHNFFTKMCSGSEAGSYSRLVDFCITQLQG